MRKLLNSLLKRAPEVTGEKGATFYDDAFTNIPGYHAHYTASEYYFVWTVIIDQAPIPVEIGCGPGQFARAIGDAFPVIDYVGFDVGPVAIGDANAHFAADSLRGRERPHHRSARWAVRRGSSGRYPTSRFARAALQERGRSSGQLWVTIQRVRRVRDSGERQGQDVLLHAGGAEKPLAKAPQTFAARAFVSLLGQRLDRALPGR